MSLRLSNARARAFGISTVAFGDVQSAARLQTRDAWSLWLVAAVAVTAGLAAATSYYLQDLTLSHDDAKARLVVARRIVDSIRPGWMQIGAVWLPLPQLLNVIPVQSDWMYRTGLSAVGFSVAGFVLGATSLWWLVQRATRSTPAAWTAFAVFASQPDVLYLQATPMTESLLMGLCLLAIARTWSWVTGAAEGPAWPAGVALALACLTRYEAWPITAAGLLLAVLALIRLGVEPRQAVGRVSILAAYPAVAVLAFLALSRATVGAWLVTGGFYEIDRAMYHQPLVVLGAVVSGVRTLYGDVAIALGALGLVVVSIVAWRHRLHAPLLVVLALIAGIAFPLYGFWNGHPFRIRFMVPLTMSLAVLSGLGVGLLPRYRMLAAAVVIATALASAPRLSGDSPTVQEAQWDRATVLARQRVAACLAGEYDQTAILASMSSLAPFMQETSRAGFALRRYIHEGIGQMWSESLVSARRHAGWVLIEERTRGGDVLAQRRHDSPEFLEGFERTCDGGGVVLYRRRAGGASRAAP